MSNRQKKKKHDFDVKIVDDKSVSNGRRQTTMLVKKIILATLRQTE